MKNVVEFTLSYEGSDANRHAIDLYDVAQALVGFQRSIALTTHLILNDEIITQSPALKGADIYALPAVDGSWKITAGVVITLSTTAYQLGTAPKDTPLGHLVYSAYDYVISESLGFHVDYEKSLGQLYEEAHSKNKALKETMPKIKQSQLDSLVEKCTTAITEIHRPIYKTKTAETAVIVANLNGQNLPLSKRFSLSTYEYLNESIEEDKSGVICGRISSYNSNTFKGRIFVREEGRPISFVLSENARNDETVELIVNSLSENALKKYDSKSSVVQCQVFKITSKTGLLKSYKISKVSKQEPT